MGLGTKIVITLIVLTVIGIAIWLIIRSTTNKKANQSCTYDWQCDNKKCGRLGAGGKKVCCPSGDYDLYDGYDYCTELPDGTPCWSDAMCGGGTCKGNAGGFKTGICTGGKSSGEPCDSSDECSSKNCGKQGNFDSPYLCCYEGTHTAPVDGINFCLPDGSDPGYLSDGEGCASDYQCSGGTCENNANGTTNGTCTGNQAANTTCTKDTECASRQCAYLYQNGVTSANEVCCVESTSNYVSANSTYYCDNSVPLTDPCLNKDMCVTGQSGESACGLYGGSVPRCCTSGEALEIDPINLPGILFCVNLEANNNCQSNLQCATGLSCVNGVCQAPLPVGASCPANDSVCASGKCAQMHIADGSTVYQCCPTNDDCVPPFRTSQWCAGLSVGDLCDHDCQCPKGSDCTNNKCS